MNVRLLLQLVVLGMIWGGSFMFQRITVPALGAGVTAAGRVLLAAVALLAVLAFTGRKTNFRARWKDYLLVGLGGAGLPFVAFAFAAYSLPAGYSAVLNSTVPLFTVLIGWIAGSRPSMSKIVGVVVGIFGVVTLARFGTVTLDGMTLAAFGGGLVAAILYAFNARTVRARFADTDPLVVATGSMIGAALPLFPWGASSMPAQWPLGAVLALLTVGVLCTGVAYAMYYKLIKEAGSERAVTVTFLVPIFAEIWGALFLGEAITWASAVGCALVLLAVALIFEKVPGLRPRLPVLPVLCEAQR
ncbi:MAG TPA: DMT family transporter [Rudaea sp.]|jgi:drug/metabolite transporter (DMT)-like permease|nr:DMT family transporter [Rudaea sp.]